MKIMINGMKIVVSILTIMTVFSSIVVFATGEKIHGVATEIGSRVATSNNGEKDNLASSGPQQADKQIQARGTKILNAYIWFGYAISLGMVVFIGIKYMLGAADARANMKSAIVGWLIGAFIVFMATTIASLAINFSTGSTDGNNKVDSMASGIVNALKETKK